MQKWAVFHLISKHSLNKISIVFSLWIIKEFEKGTSTAISSSPSPFNKASQKVLVLICLSAQEQGLRLSSSFKCLNSKVCKKLLPLWLFFRDTLVRMFRQDNRKQERAKLISFLAELPSILLDTTSLPSCGEYEKLRPHQLCVTVVLNLIHK